MLSMWLDDVQTFAEPESVNVFQKSLPLEWIETVLKTTNTASVRRRKLPAELVVWLIVGMGLYRDRSINDVVNKLDLVLTSELGETVAPSAVPQARLRLGQAPLEALFKLTASHWIKQEDNEDTWHGLQLFAVDGTCFRTPDSPELAEHFGYIKHRKDRHTQYPMLRLCALMSLRSRLIHDVVFGACTKGEITHTKSLNVPKQSLTLFDRCYLSAELMINWQRAHTDSHWLTPIKSNTQFKIIEEYSEGDCLIEMNVSAHARKKDPSLPETWQARMVIYQAPKGQIKGFITSLSDNELYTKDELLHVYWERWEIENGYGEIKCQQLENSMMLRSQTITGIYQELWGILIAYNLVRVEISQIAKEADVPPLRISFTMALRYIQDELLWCALAKPGTIPSKLKAMRAKVKKFILPKKRKRPKPRTVRISKTNYTIQLKHA